MALFDFFKKKKQTDGTANEPERSDAGVYGPDEEELAELDAALDGAGETLEELLEEAEPVELDGELPPQGAYIPDEEPEQEIEYEEKPTKKGLFSRLVEGLGKTRNAFTDKVDSVFQAFTKIDDDLYDDLEETLIFADIGGQTSMEIVDMLRERVKEKHITDSDEAKEELKAIIAEILSSGDSELHIDTKPTVVLVIGVNGVGKTTTIGKLTNKLKREGKTVVLAAADTFRAAAADQLEIWAERNGVQIVRLTEGADPAAVIFDGCNAARKREADVLICDTAGRLHNKKNLMEELKKINRVIERELPDARKEVLLVLDATTGQNAVNQAEEFNKAAGITGIVLTKLDGTAKGGIVIQIIQKLGIPVKFVGVGEGINDLQVFDAEDFAAALFPEK